MGIAVQGQWDAISGQFAELAEQASKFVVAVHGGGRIAASGIMWRSGIVVTASHMLRRGGEFEIALWDNSVRKASLAGRDPGTDLAVLRLEGASVEALPQFGNPAELRVGQIVMAVGRSTLGELSASAGIIARLGASWQTWRGGRIDSLLRPDVTLYRGQSGSALVDSRARILGMNTSALARSAAITIPTATVGRVVDEVMQHGGVFRPYLGLAMQAIAIPEDLRSKFSLAQESALMVMQVEPASPSSEAGIMLGDVIFSIGGVPAHGIEQVQRALNAAKRGDSVEIQYVRGGQRTSVNVKLVDRPRS